MSRIEDKIIIGRLEKVNIPELELQNVIAKIDTGAYRGSIHATEIREIEKKGKKYVEFKILDSDHPEYSDKVYSFSNYKIKKFRNSGTDPHERYVIFVTLEISDQKLPIEISLSNRADLRYPILIGRRFLKEKFLIDASKKNI